jgi:non-ribosomal peptide synthetase component F
VNFNFYELGMLTSTPLPYGELPRLLSLMTGADKHLPSATSTLDVMGPSERSLLVEAWNRTEAAYPRGRCLHHLFEEQGRRAPDAVALEQGALAVSYRELERRANGWAHELVRLGVELEGRVAICARRSPRTVIGLMAVLKAGGAWVPLDPAHPAQRLLDQH